MKGMTPSGPIFRIKPPNERKDHRLHGPRQALLRIHERREQPRPEKLQRQTYEHRGDHQQRETFAGLPEDKDAAQDFKAPLHVFRPENTHRKDTK